MSDDTRTGGTPWWSLCTVAPVLVYFLFPHLYLLPYVLATKSQPPPTPSLQALFAPVRFLAGKFPAYRALLKKESEWTGVR